MATSLQSRLSNLRLLTLDVDGVLTDGGIYFGANGQIMRRFHVHDGLGIKALRGKDIETAIITGHTTEAVARRAKQLGIAEVHQGVSDKLAVLKNIVQKHDLAMEQVAYIGDDLTDLPVLEQVGAPFAVANAVPEVKQVASYVTDKCGGNGAVREVCDIILHSLQSNPQILGVIPARYASTRFPGKPLADILGKPMIYHVYQRAKGSCLDEVIVATDDKRILEVCEKLGCRAVLTSTKHDSGTDRVAEVARDVNADVLVNIQGDEPLISPELIDALVTTLVNEPGLDMATGRRQIEDEKDLDNPNVVKVIVDCEGYAIYFSRATIPYWRGRDKAEKARITQSQYYKHIGIYGYRRSALLQLAELAPTSLELAESLEQLRALEHGMKIKVIDTWYESIGVDTPTDLERVREIMRGERE